MLSNGFKPIGKYLIFIHLILGKKIYFTTIIGLVLIITGIVVQQ